MVPQNYAFALWYYFGYFKVHYLRNMMIRVDAVFVRAVIPDSILLSIVGIGRGVGVVGGGT